MSDLIERLERAAAADRELDRDIARSLEQLPTKPFTGPSAWDMHKGMFWVYGKKDTKDGSIEEKWSRTAPRYTSSVDAALTLVPENSAWAISRGDPDPEGYPKPFRATVMPPLVKDGYRDATEWHTHSAIALCIAALKTSAHIK